jgi:Flp pilus assembly protein TadG
MKIRQSSSFKKSGKFVRKNGSAIVETAVGLFVLLPVFLILIDLLALVIGQTINDDIAKKAARYAAEGSTQVTAQAYADNYMSSISYTGPTGLVSNAHIIGSVQWNTNQTRVVTEVTINLPIAVPFGGPTYQIMQTQSTYPTTGVSATAGATAAAL